MSLRILTVFLALSASVSCFQSSFEYSRPDDSQAGPNSGAFLQASAIFRSKCSACHAWANYNYEVQFVNNSPSLVTPRDLARSLLFTKLRGNGGYNPPQGFGTSSMPPAGVLTSDEISVIRTWITSMVPQSQGGSGNQGPSVITMEESPRLPDRSAVASHLRVVYGPDAQSILDNQVFRQLAYFGGSCTGYSYDSSKVANCQSGGRSNYSVAFSMTPSTSALGYITRACYEVNQRNVSVTYAIAMTRGIDPSQVGTTPTPPSAIDIAAAFTLFNPGREMPPDVRAALSDLVARANGIPGRPALEPWRYLFLSLCSAPSWLSP